MNVIRKCLEVIITLIVGTASETEKATYNAVNVIAKMTDWFTTKPLTKYVMCPNCHKDVLVHWGSFLGGGKKCPRCNKVFHMRDGVIQTRTKKNYTYFSKE